MFKKTAILQAATRLFSENGFHGASIGEITELTGAARGTIFHHFKSKEEILITILEELKTGLIGAFDQYLGENKFDTGLDMMEGIISFYLYLAGQMEEKFILLHQHHTHKLAEVNPECREYLEAIYNYLVDLFEKTIARGQEDGSIRHDSSPRKLALILFSTADGLVYFRSYNLYDAGALYTELLKSCRRILENR